MSKINSVCVYCGARSDVDPIFKENARELGEVLAREKVRLVYGGGKVGLMGIVSSAAFKNGGEVTGIIPEHIQGTEQLNTEVTEIFVVDSMHTRKRMMVERSDAFVVLPGGFGTLDETFEILTWKYLGLHDKPVVFLNTKNYYKPLLKMVDHMVDVGFTPFWQRNMFQVVERPEEVLPALRANIEHINPNIKRL